MATVWSGTRRSSSEQSILALICKFCFTLSPANPVLSSLGISKSEQNLSLFLARDTPTKERTQCGKIHSKIGQNA